MTSSGRIHGEFLRLLYILAHRRTTKYFAELRPAPGEGVYSWLIILQVLRGATVGEGVEEAQELPMYPA